MSNPSESSDDPSAFNHYTAMSDKREFDAGIDLDDDEVFEYATARLDEVNEAQLAREYELDDSDQDYIKTLYVDPPFSEKAKYELLTNPLPYVSALATGAVLFAGFRAFKNNQRHLYQPLMRGKVKEKGG